METERNGSWWWMTSQHHTPAETELEQTNEYVVRAENDSETAMAAAEEFRPDLILLDVMMPGLDGGELASRFEANPKLKACQ